jgi:tetratricopeptide (TPR) repeat protein
VTALLYTLVAIFIVLCISWLFCVNRLSRELRDRYPGVHKELHLDEMWPRGWGWLGRHDNTRAVFALMRFLFSGRYRELDDPYVTDLGTTMRRMFVGSLAIFAMVVWLIQKVPPPEARTDEPLASVSPHDQVRARAFDLHRAGKHAEAIAAYDEVLRASAADAEALQWRGTAHWKLNRVDAALDDFYRVIELQPTNFEVHIHADRILSNQRRWDDVIVLWTAYLRRMPSDAGAYFERGGAHYRKHDLPSAKADAVRACELGKAEACAMVERLKQRWGVQ